jgi:hypothetical protein
MYEVLSKDIIENEILPHLSTAKRGFKAKSYLIEISQSHIIQAQNGHSMAMLSVESQFSTTALSYKTVFGHFRKWRENGACRAGSG